MEELGVVVVASAKSPMLTLLAMGIICIVGGAVMTFNLFQRRIRAESWPEPNPLVDKFRSNLKRAYLNESKLSWPRYFIYVLFLVGTTLILLSGLLALVSR